MCSGYALELLAVKQACKTSWSDAWTTSAGSYQCGGVVAPLWAWAPHPISDLDYQQRKLTPADCIHELILQTLPTARDPRKGWEFRSTGKAFFHTRLSHTALVKEHDWAVDVDQGCKTPVLEGRCPGPLTCVPATTHLDTISRSLARPDCMLRCQTFPILE